MAITHVTQVAYFPWREIPPDRVVLVGHQVDAEGLTLSVVENQ